MVESIRTGQGRVLFAPQVAEGSPATEAAIELHRVDGTAKSVKETGELNIPDGRRYGRDYTWVRRLTTELDYQVVATPEASVAILSNLFSNAIVSGSAPYTHTIDTASNEFSFCTIWDEVGSATGLKSYRKFEDCIITEATYSASAESDQPNMWNIKMIGSGSETYSASPTITNSEQSDPHTWIDGDGSFELDGTVLAGATSFEMAITTGINPRFASGLSSHTIEVNFTESAIEIAGALILDADGIGKYNKAVYGVANPSNGSSPAANILETSFEVGYSYGTGAAERSLIFTAETARIAFEEDIAFNQSGETVLPFKAKPVRSADGSTEALSVEATLGFDYTGSGSGSGSGG